MEQKRRQLTNVQAIKEYFARDGGRAVTLAEMQELTREDRIKLGEH